MSLYALADHMASKGRNGDTMLVHMTPGEVAGLQALAEDMGGHLTINPETGLPEANFLKKLGKALKKALPAVAGFALNAFAPGLGSAIGGALGTSAAVGTGIAIGGATALATGSLSRGLTAGLGAYGGAAIGGGITGAGVGAAQQAAIGALGPGASQEAMNLAAAEATKNYLGSAPGMWTASAPIGIGERLMQSASAAFANPSSVVQNMGGLNKVLQAGYAAATPAIMASAEEQKNEMPKALGSPAYYRPYEYDPETKGLRSLGTVDAAKANATPIAPSPKPVNVQTTTPMPGMASGGIARLASGGPATGSVLDASQPNNRLRVNNEVLDPRLEPYFHNTPDGRVSMYMGDGWYSGFASGQELEDLKAKQRANFERLGLQQQQQQQQPTTGLASLPTTTPSPAPGGISDLVYRPLSQVNSRFAEQGGAENPLNDRMQGLEKVIRDRGLMDEFSQYWQLTNTTNDFSKGYGASYDPAAHVDKRFFYDDDLQRSYYNAVANNLTEAERQRAAGDLLNILQQYEDGARTRANAPQITSTEATRPTTNITPSSYTVSGESIAAPTSTAPPQITSTEATRPTTNITPSSYTVSGESIAAPTSTAPPQITSTEAVRPTTNITPSFLTTQAAAPVPLTSTAPPAITASAAPIMPSIPVGGGGDAGMAAVRPFDWQSTPLEELPEARQKSIEEAMTGQSLEAYRRLMGLGAAQLTGSQSTAAPNGVRTATPYAYVNSPFVFGPSDYTGMPVSRAAGGPIHGYALGGLSSLGGFSDGGQLLKGPGDGVSDSIPATIGGARPARLADGEFVVPARIVSELGNGSTEAGARKLYAMMDRVQNARGKTIGKGRVAVDAHADKYLPA